MRLKAVIKLLFIPITFLCSGCNDDEVQYEIDSTLKPYLHLFLNEAKERGVNINPQEDGLIMKFSNLKAPTIGLCTYSQPILVEIDRSYWEETANYADKDMLRENVVFHELGHGLLNRDHTNVSLDNNEWRSIMCGGEKYMDRAWNINYNGYRREYYLNELFNFSEKHPEWAKSGTFDGNKGELYAEINLQEEQYIEKNGIIFQIKDGEYSISRNDNNTNNINTELLFGELFEDFYFETTISCPITIENQIIGISAGYSKSNKEDAFHYLYLTQNNKYMDSRYYIAHSDCMGPFAEILQPRLNTSKFNHFAIQKCNNELFFYVNNQLVYRNDYEINHTFKSFGLIIPSNSTMKINLIKIYTTQKIKTKSSTDKIISESLKITDIDNRFISPKRK